MDQFVGSDFRLNIILLEVQKQRLGQMRLQHGVHAFIHSLQHSCVCVLTKPVVYRLQCVSTLKDCKWRSNTNDQPVQMCFECDCVLGLIER